MSVLVCTKLATAARLLTILIHLISPHEAHGLRNNSSEKGLLFPQFALQAALLPRHGAVYGGIYVAALKAKSKDHKS